MELSKTEARVFGYLLENGTFTVSGLSSAIGVKKSNLSKYLKKLEEYSLVAAIRKGATKEISPQRSHVIWFSDARKSLPSIKAEDIMSGKTPYLISSIEEGKTFRIKDFDLPAITLKRIFGKLRKIGVIYQQSKGAYSLRAEAYEIRGFCRHIIIEMHAAKARKELGNLENIYVSFRPKGPDIVFVTKTGAKTRDYWLTAYSVLHKYGVNLIHAGKFYYSNRKPDLIDAISDMLRMGKDARTLAYAAAAMVKNPFRHEKLLEKKDETIIRNLIEFVRTRGKRMFGGFPAWNEVEAVING